MTKTDPSVELKCLLSYNDSIKFEFKGKEVVLL